MVLKTSKRIKQRLNVIEKDELIHVEKGAVQSKSDDVLFTLDNEGNSSQRGKSLSNEEKEAKRRRKEKISDNDRLKIQKLIRANKPEKLARMTQKKRKRKAAMFDLWAANPKMRTVVKMSDGPSPGGLAPVVIVQDDMNAIKLSKSTMKARKAAKSNARAAVAVEMALPGQSYLPDTEGHQDVIGQALAIELRRKEALDYEKAPLSNGMTEATLAILLDSNDEDEESSNEEGNEADGVTEFRGKKKKDKLTRAQRNKQKRVKRDEVALQLRKKERKFLNSVNEVKKIRKTIVKDNEEKEERKGLIQKLKKEMLAKPLGVDVIDKLAEIDPLKVSSLPVALTHELEQFGGKLRTLKPKGCLMQERIESMADRNMLFRKQTTKRHAQRNKKRKPGKDWNLILK